MTEGGNVSTQEVAADERLEALSRWLRAMPQFAPAVLEPASDDASFRRYFRVQLGAESWIVMDAPPPMEDCRPFVDIATRLRNMSLNAPEIIAEDLSQGFLLMTDLGDDTYLNVLNAQPQREASLYDDAIDALLVMQQRGQDFLQGLPAYDQGLLQRELALFRDWLCGRHLGITFSEDEDRAWQDLCGRLVDNALQQPQVFVHRDYHSRNLMVTPAANPGVIDFQDAVTGPLSYDLVSLLKDCYYRLSASRIDAGVTRFHAGLEAADVDVATFRRQFELMGVQRHLKAAGIFARLLHRDGKDRYMADVPTALDYLCEASDRVADIGWLGDLIRGRVVPAMAQRFA